jgi:hypothetical protein
MTVKLFVRVLLSFVIAIDSYAREPIKHPPATPGVEAKTVHARDLVPFEGTPGTFNAITDVPGVEVGYATLITGEGKLEVGKGPVRTGVTAILPRRGLMRADFSKVRSSSQTHTALEWRVTR